MWRTLLVYNLLLPVALVFLLPLAWVKMRRRGGGWRELAQRFTLWPQERQAALAALPAAPQALRYWVHAVSVGEVNVARKLITALLRERPEACVVLTTTTPTGYALAIEAEAAAGGRLVALYSPLDLPMVARRALRLLAPERIILVEAEVWPNLMQAAQHAGVPVSLVNARLSGRSERRYKKFRSLSGPVFAMLDQLMVQEQADVQRWAGIGAEPGCIHVTGSIKYDPQGSAPSAQQVADFGQMLGDAGLGGRPLLLAASTHAGEERELAQVFLKLKKQHPQLGLVLVPRHFERGAEVQSELAALGLAALLRSRGVQQTTEVLILDSTGELKAWTEHAAVVVIGKSFLAEGGQNPAEAIMAGKPVVCGPHMENFLPLMQLLRGVEAVVEVAGLPELATALSELLQHPEQGRQMAERGRAALMAHDGATRRTVELLVKEVEIN
jgi:3-deoxy-D-manno-octulosonic-acid transferase